MAGSKKEPGLGKKRNIRKLVINRARWGTSALYNSRSRNSFTGTEGSMCCLGFACRAAGLRVHDILDYGQPSDVMDAYRFLPAWLAEDSADVAELTSLNDSFFGSEKTEDRIKAIFAKHGIAVRFVGKFRKGLVPLGARKGTVRK